MRGGRALLGALVVLGLARVAAADGAVAPPADVHLSEFLASNSTGIQDTDGTFPDWVELTNPGSTPVDLAGWSLSDSASNPSMWTFPAVTLPAGGTIVVFADGKDIKTDPARLHTNFKLSAGGEYLGLYRPDGSLAGDFAPQYPAQTADRSYGIDSNGEARYFSTPSPGVRNGPGDAQAVAAVTTSVPRGLYSSAQTVTLSTATAGAVIRYTTDGSAPSSTNGTLYSAPLSIARTTTLRAMATAPGFSASPVSTTTYLFAADVTNQPAGIPGFPDGRLKWVGGDQATNQVPEDTAMDPAVVGNPAYAGELPAALRSIPTIALSLPLDTAFGANGFYDQEDVEQPVSVEVLYPDNPAANEQVDAGIKGHSWDRLKRSMRLKFRAQYGADSWTTALLQRDPVLGATATSSFDTLVLRAGNNRAWSRIWNPDATDFTLDQLVRGTQVAIEGYGSHGTFAHVYINGVYWGLYNPSERPDDEFAASYFGGAADDWFYYKGDNSDPSQGGDETRWSYLTTTLAASDLSSPAAYTELQQYLDVESFADYLIMQWWFGITDWPDNNFYAVNRNPSSPLGATPTRFLAWDGEWSMDRKLSGGTPGAWVHPAFVAGSTSDEIIPRLWRALQTSPQFRQLFAQRVDALTGPGGALSDAKVLERYDALNASVRSAVVAESARWGDSLEALGQPLRTRDVDWQREVDAIRGLINGNSARLLTALRAQGYYPAGSTTPNGPDQLLVSRSADRGGAVALAGTTVATGEPIFVFLQPAAGSAVTKVDFWLDRDPTGTPSRTEGLAPYDLGGGSVTTATAVPALAAGAHTVHARATLSDGSTRSTTASFTVSAVTGTTSTTTSTTAASTTSTTAASTTSTTAASTTSTSGTTPSTTTTVPSSGDVLQVSRRTDRGGATALAGAQLATGEAVAVFLATPTPYLRVSFYVDNPAATGTPFHVEALAPWDLNGGTVGAASLLPQTTPGTHSVTVVGLRADNTVVTTTATYTVGSTGGSSSTTAPPTSTTSTTSTSTTSTSTTSTTLPPTTSTTVATPTEALRFSTSPTRSAAGQLAGARLAPSVPVAIFLASPTAYTKVEFYLGAGTTRGALQRTELLAPWDFNGGNATSATLFSLAGRSGTYTVTAVATLAAGGTTSTTATFTVG
ncbi:MAG: CotH kinase family protein [Acidimicrobiales bacterium]|nr:CotH kinase family protein [Acidimicrobiales bacterium]